MHIFLQTFSLVTKSELVRKQFNMLLNFILRQRQIGFDQPDRFIDTVKIITNLQIKTWILNSDSTVSIICTIITSIKEIGRYVLDMKSAATYCKWNKTWMCTSCPSVFVKFPLYFLCIVFRLISDCRFVKCLFIATPTSVVSPTSVLFIEASRAVIQA